MAKVFGPALSIDAKGKIGEGVAYQRRPTGTVIMKNPRPGRHSLDNPSAAQQIQRNAVASLISQWQALTAAEKYYWDYLAEKSGLNIKGYHYFMKKKGGFLALEDGLVLYLPFRYGSGGVAADYSGFKNNGILKPTFPANCPAWVAGKNEKLGKAMQFDGVDDYVDCGNDSSFNITDAITIEAWVKLASGWDSHGVITIKSNGTNWNDANWYLRVGSDKKIRMLWGSGSDSKYYITNDAISENVWHHIVVTWDKIYIDGSEMATTPSGTATTHTTTTHNIIIGASDIPSVYFNGSIDEVRIYNRALGADEIKTHYLRGI